MNLSDWLKEERGRAVVLAKHLNLTPVTVSEWSTAKKKVALEHCPHIEAFTAGAVTCEELRPDKADYFRLVRQSPVGPQHSAAMPQGAA